MSEVLRVRMVRAPNRTVPKMSDLVLPHVGEPTQLLTLLLVESDQQNRIALNWIDNGNLLDDPPVLRTQLLQLDDRLVQANNRLEPGEVMRILSPDGHMDPRLYDIDRSRLGDSLLACVLAERFPERAVLFNRLLLVCGLVELLRDHPSLVADAEAVYRALRWSVVVLPELVSVPADLLSRRPGFADLYLVRQDWVKYEAGEVAHIENVLRGESKQRTHTRVDESEITIFSETEESFREELDSQTADRFELPTEASRQAELAVHLEGSVDVQGPAGPTTVQGHVGGSVDFSQSTADMRVLTTSHEAVSRAVNVIEARMREVRTTRRLTRVTEINDHRIDNSQNTTGHAIGIYR
jgi:hypothetical protein